MAEVFRVGAVAFDDSDKLVALTLPTNAKDDTPITFHDSAGANYQVPSGYKLIIGLSYASLGTLLISGRIGGSNTADSGISVEGITFGVEVANRFERKEVMAIIPSDKYVTGETTSSGGSDLLFAGTSVYGVLLPN